MNQNTFAKTSGARPERRRLLATWAPMMLDSVVQLVSLGFQPRNVVEMEPPLRQRTLNWYLMVLKGTLE